MKFSTSGKLFALGAATYLLGSALERLSQARGRPQGHREAPRQPLTMQGLSEEQERILGHIAQHYGISREEALGVYLDYLCEQVR